MGGVTAGDKKSEGIIGVDVAKSTTIPLSGLNIAVTEGKWLSGSTDDTTCNLTIIVHYITV